MDLVIEILKFGLLNTFLIAFLFLFNSKGLVIANRLFGALILILSIIILENLLIVSNKIQMVPHLFSVGSSMLFLIPPLSYFLQKHLFDPKEHLKKIDLLIHSLPFVLTTLTLLPIFLLDAQKKIEIIEHVYVNHQKVTGHYVLYSVINIIQFVVYNALIFKEIKLKKLLRNNKSIQNNIQWVYRLMLILNIIIVAYIMVYISFIISNDNQTIFMIGFISLLLITIFMTTSQLIKNPFYFEKSFGTYNRSTLKTDISSKLDEDLISLITKEKPFLDPDIKLAELASMLDVSSHQLSQFLNQKMNTTYNAMVNSFRVDHAKNLLNNDPLKEKTILSIALDSGFTSQSNFIRVFKNYTNLTPSEYRIQQIKKPN